MPGDDCGNGSPMAMGPRGDAHTIIKRFERRVPAAYRLVQHRSTSAVPRLMAHALSSYERTRFREVVLILLDTAPVFDGRLRWMARRRTFAMANRPLADDDLTLDMTVPSSGRPYMACGAISGAPIPIVGLLTVAAPSRHWMGLPGALGGAVTGRTWWPAARKPR